MDSDLVGSKSIDDCTNCTKGTYQYFTGSTTCSIAEPGSYCGLDGMSTPKMCPENTLAQYMGALFVSLVLTRRLVQLDPRLASILLLVPMDSIVLMDTLRANYAKQEKSRMHHHRPRDVFSVKWVSSLPWLDKPRASAAPPMRFQPRATSIVVCVRAILFLQ